MKAAGFSVVCTSLTLLSGCHGETYDSVALVRHSDGAKAGCYSGTYAVGPFDRDKSAPWHVTRCVVACEKLGFVVVRSEPRPDLVFKRDDVRDVTENECSKR